MSFPLVFRGSRDCLREEPQWQAEKSQLLQHSKYSISLSEQGYKTSPLFLCSNWKQDTRYLD